MPTLKAIIVIDFNPYIFNHKKVPWSPTTRFILISVVFRECTMNFWECKVCFLSFQNLLIFLRKYSQKFSSRKFNDLNQTKIIVWQHTNLSLHLAEVSLKSPSSSLYSFKLFDNTRF